jgi:hypothetical protein
LVAADNELAVFAYGIEIFDGDDTDVLVYRRDPDTKKTMYGQFNSVHRALKVYSRLMPLRLLWVNENEWDDELEELSAG